MRAAAFSLAMVASFGAAQAQWTPSGPFGGAAEIVRVAPQQPDLVLAATANALVYQSRNGGASWAHLAFPAQFAGTLHALELDPRVRGTWYIGIESENPAVAGVYKTQDAGATWKRMYGLRRPPRRLPAFSYLVRGNGSIASRMWEMVGRACYCPIVYNSLEAFKDEMGYRNHA